MKMEKQPINEEILLQSINHVLFGKQKSSMKYSLDSEKCTDATRCVFSKKHYLDRRLVVKKKKCPICLEYIGSTLCVVQCGHIYHKDCEKRWRSRSKTCAVCRETVKYIAVLSNFWGAYVLRLEVKTLKRNIAKALDMRK